jgi:tRNA (mo5U34)-methyltransferase
LNDECQVNSTATIGNQRSELRARVEMLAPWFHNLHFPDGTQTAPNHPLGGDFPAFKWRQLAPHVPADLNGWSVLDIGCNAGFYSFELARRGARVLGIDIDPHYLDQARWACEQFQLQDRVRFEQKQVYDLAASDEMFDLVLFMGVFYHLRYPTLALDMIARKVSKLLVFQTLTMLGNEVHEHTADHEMDDRGVFDQPGWPKMAFIEHRFAGDPTNWWVPNHACVEAMLRCAGLNVVLRPGHELYLCRPDRDNPSAIVAPNTAELRSATQGVFPRDTPERSHHA